MSLQTKYTSTHKNIFCIDGMVKKGKMFFLSHKLRYNFSSNFERIKIAHSFSFRFIFIKPNGSLEHVGKQSFF